MLDLKTVLKTQNVAKFRENSTFFRLFLLKCCGLSGAKACESPRAFQRVFTCRSWLRYSRERALQSLPALRVQTIIIITDLVRIIITIITDLPGITQYRNQREFLSMEKMNTVGRGALDDIVVIVPTTIART